MCVFVAITRLQAATCASARQVVVMLITNMLRRQAELPPFVLMRPVCSAAARSVCRLSFQLGGDTSGRAGVPQPTHTHTHTHTHTQTNTLRASIIDKISLDVKQRSRDYTVSLPLSVFESIRIVCVCLCVCVSLNDCVPVCYQSEPTQRVLITVLYDDLWTRQQQLSHKPLLLLQSPSLWFRLSTTTCVCVCVCVCGPHYYIRSLFSFLKPLSARPLSVEQKPRREKNMKLKQTVRFFWVLGRWK